VYTVSLTVTDSLGLSDSTPATRTVTVSESGGTIPQSGWTLLYVDSEETTGEDGQAENAFDGDPDTLWHTQWLRRDPVPPHEIQIDLGATYDIGGFQYLPIQENGHIGQYAFYVSTDGVDWGSAVATGSFVFDLTEKEVVFATVTGRYIRLVALSEVNGNPWTSVAEINVLGAEQ
jgi:PKD repeat protein